MDGVMAVLRRKYRIDDIPTLGHLIARDKLPLCTPWPNSENRLQYKDIFIKIYI